MDDWTPFISRRIVRYSKYFIQILASILIPKDSPLIIICNYHMLEEKSPRVSSGAESDLRTTLPVEELQAVTHVFLALLTDLNHQQTLTNTTTSYLSLVQSLLHIMTDLETQLTITRETLERERLINNEMLINYTRPTLLTLDD